MQIKILVVENSESNKSIIKKTLSEYSVLIASSVVEAMNILAEDKSINLLLLDLNITDGFKLLEFLKEDEGFNALRTIILTNSGESENEIKALKLGAVDYIRKPLYPDTLKERIGLHTTLLRIKQTRETTLPRENIPCKSIEEALHESERRQSVFLHHLPGLAYRCDYDRDWTMKYVSEGCHNLTGYHPESLLYNRDLSFNELISPEYREVLWDRWNQILKEKEPFKYEYEIITASGEKKWVIEMAQGIYNENGEVEALEGIVLDISDRKAVENALKYNNEHDRWTGLYNRDYLETVFLKDTKQKQRRAFIGINLSTVEVLTAKYGFQYTQGLIKKAAEKLEQFNNEKRILFYPNQSRFIFYITDYQNSSLLVEFAREIAEAMERLFIIERIGGGIGVLEIKEDDELDLDLLLRKILVASERAINDIETDFSICFYDEKIDAAVNRERDITEALNRIVDGKTTEDDIFLHYQPILDLKTGLICSFEALARLRTEKLGVVSPLEFIPLAEKTKLILPLGEKVFGEAFRFLNKLKEYGYQEIGISINISVIQLMNPDFLDKLFALMKTMQINPKNVGIEITESIFASNYETINYVIEKLRNTGMTVAIDDFGTGYSSLAREGELKVDCIKIDKYFIDKLINADLNKAITCDIISMSHKLGHCIIAEGVEQETQLQYLKNHNCDRVQGYLISKPLSEKAAIELLIKEGEKRLSVL